MPQTDPGPVASAPPARPPRPIVAAIEEPVSEADREPEPEFEPDDSPIVSSRPPTEWAASAPPAQAAAPPAPAAAPPAPSSASPSPSSAAPAPAPAAPGRSGATKPTKNAEFEKTRYGEAVVREILGANFIEELPVAPRVAPRGD